MSLRICPIPIPIFSTLFLVCLYLTFDILDRSSSFLYFLLLFSYFFVFLLYLLSDFLSFIFQIFYWPFSSAIIFQIFNTFFLLNLSILYRNILTAPVFSFVGMCNLFSLFFFCLFVCSLFHNGEFPQKSCDLWLKDPIKSPRSSVGEMRRGRGGSERGWW